MELSTDYQKLGVKIKHRLSTDYQKSENGQLVTFLLRCLYTILSVLMQLLNLILGGFYCTIHGWNIWRQVQTGSYLITAWDFQWVSCYRNTLVDYFQIFDSRCLAGA